MSTAQERLRAVVRDRLAPALRTLGLRGSGQVYTLPSELCWAQLGLQRGTWSDRGAVHFTVNLSVVSRAEWEQALATKPWIGAKPTPNIRAPVESRFHERIGPVVGTGDYWWSLRADGSNEKATCRDFLTMMAEHAVPTLQREVASRY